MADRNGCAAQLLVQSRTPIRFRGDLGPQCPKNQRAVLKRVPASIRRRQSKIGITFDRRQLEVSPWPLPHQFQRWAGVLFGSTEVERQLTQRRLLAERRKQPVREPEKSVCQRHRDRCAEDSRGLTRSQGDLKNLGKVLRFEDQPRQGSQELLSAKPLKGCISDVTKVTAEVEESPAVCQLRPCWVVGVPTAAALLQLCRDAVP